MSSDVIIDGRTSFINGFCRSIRWRKHRLIAVIHLRNTCEMVAQYIKMVEEILYLAIQLKFYDSSHKFLKR